MEIDKTDEISIIDLVIACQVCQYIDNSDDPILNFNGTDFNTYEFKPRILYDYHRGGILACIKSIIAQYELDSKFNIGLILDQNKRTMKNFKITQYKDSEGNSLTPSLASVFVGSYTNQLYVNSMITCDFQQRTIHITFAGTNGIADVWTDIQFDMVPTGIPRYDAYSVEVHRGALEQLLKNGFAYQLVYTVLTTIRSTVLLVGDGKPWTISVNGYSLGAMQAQLFVLFMNDHILNRNGYMVDGVSGRQIDIRYKLNLLGSPPVGNKRLCQILTKIISGTFVDLPLVGDAEKPASSEINSVVDFNTVPGEILSVISYNDPVVFAKEHVYNVIAIPLLVPVIERYATGIFDYLSLHDYILSEPNEHVKVFGIGDDNTISRIPDTTTFFNYFRPSICYYANFIPNIIKYHDKSHHNYTYSLFEKISGMRPEDVSII